MKNKLLFCTIMCVLPLIAREVRAAVFYTPNEYNSLYNEKVALEIELKTLKRQYANEKARLEARITELENSESALKKSVQLLENSLAEQRKDSNERIASLEKQLAIMKEQGDQTQRRLIEESERMQKKYRDENEQLKNDLDTERRNNIAELARVKREYDQRIAALKDQIDSLNDALNELKKLNEQQKQELDRMTSQAGELEKQLADEIEKGDIRLRRLHDRIIINIDNRISFDSGSALLKRDIYTALDKIRAILMNYPENTILIEGHTDDVPIRTAQFRDNWQLSTERALAVLAYLLRDPKLDAKRFTATGHAEFSPEVPNTSEQNRALNRRVDIVVIPRISSEK